MNSWGCAIDGCTDRIVIPSVEASEQENISKPQTAACVIMPEKTTGYYKTGIDAQKSRICRGYRSEERRVGKECRYRWSPDH